MLRPTFRPAASAALVLTVALGVAGCGGDDDTQPKSGSSTAVETPSINPTPDPSQPAATVPGDLKTTTTTTDLPVPSEGPTGIQKFPVPKGVQVTAPAAQAKSWQFDIISKDVDGVLAFYRKELAAQGYKIRNDVVEERGDEKVKYDIAFTGVAEGYVIADKSQDDVFVVVRSPPEGLY